MKALLSFSGKQIENALGILMDWHEPLSVFQNKRHHAIVLINNVLFPSLVHRHFLDSCLLCVNRIPPPTPFISFPFFLQWSECIQLMQLTQNMWNVSTAPRDLWENESMFLWQSHPPEQKTTTTIKKKEKGKGNRKNRKQKLNDAGKLAKLAKKKDKKKTHTEKETGWHQTRRCHR